VLFQAPFLADGLSGFAPDDYRAQTGVRLGCSWQDFIKHHGRGTPQANARRKHDPRKLAIARRAAKRP